MHTGMSYSNKRMKIETHYAHVKRKATTAPSTPSNDFDKSVSFCMHWRDDCSHMIIEMRLKDSTHPKVGSEGLKDDSNNKGKIVSQIGKYGF
jgi:hypothetical protein